jgi:probable HAF family extracellular repeat protein
MRFPKLTSIVAIARFTLLVLPLHLAAQDKARPQHRYHHYQLIDVGTFGGPNSSYLEGAPVGRLLNKSGTAVGSADTPTPDPYCMGFNFDCYVAYGFKWQDGVASQLSALPGFNGLNGANGVWVSDSGLTAGISENGLDPLTGGPAVEAILWGTDNSLTDLGTLGGNQSSANAVNNRGQVAGEALNTIPDPYTSDYANFFISGTTQVHAVRWTQSRGMQDLGTLGSGTDSAAFSINERGQIAGWSFTNTTPNPVLDTCSAATTYVPTEDPFLWENGKMIDLGSLGGTCGQALALNNRGQVVGFSDLPGDAGVHAFLWDHTGGMQDLGTLGGDNGEAVSVNDAGDVAGSDMRADGSIGSFLWRKGVMTDLGTVGTTWGSNAFGINSRRQIVGNLLDNNGNEISAFLWEDGGPMVDLNTLIPPNSGVQLTKGLYVNDRGEIAARGVLSNGNFHAVLLVPCDEDHPGVSGCDYDLIDAETAAARVNQNPTQRPPALAPGTHMPGMFNRFRSPKSRPVPGHAPARGASLAISATPAAGDWLGDHRLVPQYGSPASYCEISNGVLTGGCVQNTGNNTCHLTLTGCNTGQPATLGSSLVCPGNHEHLLSTTKCGSVPGFDVSTTGLTPTTVSAGGSATSTLTVSAYGGFSGSVAFSCSVQPAPALAPTCSFSPSSVTSGTPSTLIVRTTAPTSALRTGTGPSLFYAFFLPLSGLFAMVLRFGPQQKIKGKFTAATLACMLFAGVVFQAACGAKRPTPGTPAGSYVITVTGTDSAGTLAIPTTMAPLSVQ